MPQYNGYSSNGRTLMVRFTCARCGREQIDELEAHKDDDRESYGRLYYIKPPKGWGNLHIHGPLLCDACMRAYEAFINNSKAEEKENTKK